MLVVVPSIVPLTGSGVSTLRELRGCQFAIHSKDTILLLGSSLGEYLLSKPYSNWLKS